MDLTSITAYQTMKEMAFQLGFVCVYNLFLLFLV